MKVYYKILTLVVIGFIYIWLFNHVNAWLSIILALVTLSLIPKFFKSWENSK